MRKLLIAFLILLFVPACAQKKDTLKISNLKCENLINPLGIDNPQPKFSWQIISTQRNTMQSAYRILVSDNPVMLSSDNGNLWDSKKVKSDQSILVQYKGKPLQSGKKYYWKVMIWDAAGNVSDWSETAEWQMGLLTGADWEKAKWICYEELSETMRVVPGVHLGGESMGNKGLQRTVVPYFRKGFRITKPVASASFYISGLGQYDAFINGTKIGNSFLAPGWTDYDKTILYNTFDVTSYLAPGKNAIGAIVGNGFYNINRERYRKLVIAYGTPKIICKLQIYYKDGTSESLVSGEDWKTASSPVTYTSIFGGEDYDARLEQPGWSDTGFDDSCWKAVKVAKHTTGVLKPDLDYPVNVMETFDVKNINQISNDKYLYDFGQNASGIFEIKVSGKKGQVIRLLPGELINEKNEVNQNATGRWHYYVYTLKGEGVETWYPQFTYYGFRYIQVEGAIPDENAESDSLPKIQELNMLHTRNSAPSYGSFQCSNELFNRIYNLINWAIKSNLQSVVTDCPHREKLSWLEQDYLMGVSINSNFEVYHLYKKLVDDMIDAQTVEGLVPNIAPEYVHFEGDFRDSPEWGSASIILPWLIYKWYSDKSTMEKSWPMMVKYIYYLKSKSDNNILSFGLGDWYDLGPERPGFAQLTPVSLTATAIYYYDLKLLSDMAGLLRKLKEKEDYEKWADEVKTAFNKKFFNKETKVYATGSQTSMAMPLCLGLVDAAYREKVMSNLIDSIDAHNKALTAGDIGFHYLVKALMEGGASQLLFEMNNRDDVPGYGYQLRKGATALTESWPALEVVSNNHLMLGHLMEWFYTGIGGIQQEENSNGYRNLIIKPVIVGDLTSAKTSFESPYGTILTDWIISEKGLNVKVNIPANSTALIYLPVKEESEITENDIPVMQNRNIKLAKYENGYKIFKTGSGNYNFWISE